MVENKAFLISATDKAYLFVSYLRMEVEFVLET
jgi:hypothetical protein